MKPTKRQAFNFLRSYFDVLNEIPNDEDKLSFLLSIINKQFLDEDPKDLSFIVKLSYESQRHAIEKSIKGWKDKTKTDLLGNPIEDPKQDPCQGGTEGGSQGPRQQEKEKGEEQVQKSIVESIDFDTLLQFINQCTKRQFKVINKTVKAKYKARLKDGYKKEDIRKAVINACKEKYHIENNYQYLTPEFFSRANTLDKYSTVSEAPQVVVDNSPVN